MNTRDVSERRTLQSQLAHQAFHDELTRLANRALFLNRIGHTVARVPRTGHLQRIAFNENGEQRRESLLTDLRQRIRDVRQGPDGLLYILTDAGALLKIEPAQ